MQGYFTTGTTGGDRFHSVPTARIYGTGSPKLVAGSDIDIPVDGRGGLPRVGIDAIIVNVKSENPSHGGYVRVTPGGFDSQTAVQEFWPVWSTSNLATVKIGRGGTIRLHLFSSSTAVFVDVVGYYARTTPVTSTTL